RSGAFELRESPLVLTLCRDEFRTVGRLVGLRQSAGNHQRTDRCGNHEGLEHCLPHVEFVLPRKGSAPCAITTRQHPRAFRALEPDLTRAEQGTLMQPFRGTDYRGQTTIARTEQA